jgi:hypothetical protein
MKMSKIRSVFAFIQLIALIQMAVSFLGPSIWKSSYSDLESHIARGGELAVKEFRSMREEVSGGVTRWGVVLAVTTLLVAAAGGLLCRKIERQHRPEDVD